MNLFDCHLHSSLSFDSDEPMENYVKRAVANGDKYFITTEHMDLESNFDNRKDIVADFQLQQRLVRQLSEKYGINVLFGIEVGWRADTHERNLETVNKYPFDMVILSVHESMDYDVAFPEFSRGRTIDDCYQEYLSLIYQALQNFDNFDTLGHIDYVLRYTGHTNMENHRKMLTDILKLLIAKGKALELNTRMLHMPQGRAGIDYVLSLYTSLGGHKVTIGSDGHDLKKFKSGFEDAKAMLKQHGIYSACVFVGRKEYSVPI